MRLLMQVNLGLTGLAILGWLSYEILALTNARTGDTISEIIWTFVRAKPFLATILCLVLGVLLGHLFWQENRDAVQDVFRRFFTRGRP